MRCKFTFGPRLEKTCHQWFVNSKGAEQPVHQRRLVCTFVVRFMESIISELASSEISIF